VFRDSRDSTRVNHLLGRVEHSLSAVRSVVRHAGVTIDDRRTGLGYDALYLPLLPRVLLLPGRCSLDVDTYESFFCAISPYNNKKKEK
jgi:hypothetical protein